MYLLENRNSFQDLPAHTAISHRVERPISRRFPRPKRAAGPSCETVSKGLVSGPFRLWPT
jgi:hypothetical protein